MFDLYNSNLYVTIVLRIKEYIDLYGNSPFSKWFNDLHTQAALKVNTYITRLEGGNISQVKALGGGIYECRIDCGPGYRVYLGKDGDTLIILLGGGTKKRQRNDIDRAKICWQDYKKRKKY